MATPAHRRECPYSTFKIVFRFAGISVRQGRHQRFYWALMKCCAFPRQILRYSLRDVVTRITGGAETEEMLTMQHVLRPYATAGVALVGASIIAVTPVAAPPIPVQVRPVQLVDAWSDLVANTTANLDNIISNASSSDITQVFSELLTNPYGVIAALANLDPTVTTDLTSLPATISVELPPGLELAIAGLGSSGATLTALESVAQQLQSDPSFTNLSEGVATVLNAYLNGQDNISLLDGAVTIPLYNGILAPETSADVNINLTSLIDALGLGNTPLTDLDLSSLLSQIGLGDLNLGSLFSDLGLSGKGLGDLLGDPTLGALLNDLGLGGLTSADGLGLGSFSLMSLLTDLGLNSSLGSVTLTQLLDALNLNTDLSSLTNVGSVTLSGLLSDLGLINPIVTDLNSALDSLLSPISGLTTLLSSVGLDVTSLFSATSLETALDSLTLGNGSPLDLTSLLGDLGITLPSPLSITGLLEALGVTIPSGDLTISSLITDVLNQLGLPIPATGDITLASLLTDLGGLTNSILDTNVGSLLNSLSLGDLLGDLGLSSLPLNLSNLGDLSGLNLGDLLGDLGLGDLANVSVEPLGGFDTLLADVVPQQLLAALGM
ncbi:MAG TPA: hypothetical protein VKG83_07210 [Mycobacterium sp.]|nr:hypothetical protein [Mycobacterium sp.]